MLGGHCCAPRVSRLSAALAICIAILAIGCHDSNGVTSPWASLAGDYRADYAPPCRTLSSIDVALRQQGSEVSASIPGFGSVEMTAAPVGQLTRVTAAAVTVENACGNANATYNYLPTDDGRTLRWFFPDGRGENCGCGVGTLSVTLELIPR
jgi:hypothetical protein